MSGRDSCVSSHCRKLNWRERRNSSSGTPMWGAGVPSSILTNVSNTSPSHSLYNSQALLNLYPTGTHSVSIQPSEAGREKVHRPVISIDTLFEMECILKIWKINHISPKSFPTYLHKFRPRYQVHERVMVPKHLVHGEICFPEANVCVFWNLR